MWLGSGVEGGYPPDGKKEGGKRKSCCVVEEKEKGGFFEQGGWDMTDVGGRSMDWIGTAWGFFFLAQPWWDESTGRRRKRKREKIQE